MKSTTKTAKFTIVFTLCALFIISIALLLPTFFSSDVASASVKNDNVVYDSVEKNIVIDENKTCDITETISVTYLRNGINVGLSRNVSRINKITRIVGGKKYVKTTKNELQLLSVTMDGEEEYNFLEERGDYFYINTGADGDYKVGKHVYEIRYLYSMGEDFINKFDDFTFDIMDYGFTNAVDSFSASITLPRAFLDGKDISDVLSFRTNNMSPLDFENVNADYDEEALTITCSHGQFFAYNGLTMQLILPQGYFDTSYTPDPVYFVALAVLIAAVVAIAAIIIASRHVKSLVVTEFYPPDGYSPLEVARAYRGDITGKDFAALIISWASKGLVSIDIRSRNQIILTKLKDFEGENLTSYSVYERMFFNRLFGFSRVYDTKSEKRLKGGAKDELNKIVKKLYKKPKEKTVNLVIKKVAISAISVIPFIFSVILNNSYMGYSSFMLFVIVFPLIALNVFMYVPMPFWFKILWCGIFGGAPLFALVATSVCTYDIFYLVYISTAVFVLGTFSSVFVRAFDKEEKAMHGRVLGFKKFLVLAELNKLNALLEDNPEYFYDILPYCYVFGITKKMQKKFAALNVPLPAYFNSVSASNVGHRISRSMHSVCGGSISSGGGHGGSGGGGGGGSGGSSGGGGGGGGCGGR